MSISKRLQWFQIFFSLSLSRLSDRYALALNTTQSASTSMKIWLKCNFFYRILPLSQSFILSLISFSLRNNSVSRIFYGQWNIQRRKKSSFQVENLFANLAWTPLHFYIIWQVILILCVYYTLTATYIQALFLGQYGTVQCITFRLLLIH